MIERLNVPSNSSLFPTDFAPYGLVFFTLKMAATPTVSNQWTNSSLDMYKEGRPPLLGTVDIKEIEDKAREAMEDDIRKSMPFIA